MVLHTCEKMAAGGIYDQIGGGFSRYSTDQQWLVPHFEKMLYDNAQLLSLYLDAYLVSGKQAYADVARRQQVYDRTVADNGAIANVCAQFVHCRFDGNAAFNAPFTTANVSTRDYFHPSVSGQAKAAAVTWLVTFDFTDAVAPTSSAQTAPDPNGGTDVTLFATDNVGVAGIEYALGTGSYQRYARMILVPAGVTLTYRAVDVNGNTEATHRLTG